MSTDQSAEPYPGTSCTACQHYNRAVVDGGPIEIKHEAELLQIWLHSTVESGGTSNSREPVVQFAIGSPVHHMLCRMIEGARQLPASNSGAKR